jgi:hypothetical protein
MIDSLFIKKNDYFFSIYIYISRKSRCEIILLPLSLPTGEEREMHKEDLFYQWLKLTTEEENVTIIEQFQEDGIVVIWIDKTVLDNDMATMLNFEDVSYSQRRSV